MIQYTTGWMVWHFRMASYAEMLPAFRNAQNDVPKWQGEYLSRNARRLQAFAFLNSPYKKQGRRHRAFVVYGKVVRMAGSRRPNASEKHPMNRGSIPERLRDVG